MQLSHLQIAEAQTADQTLKWLVREKPEVLTVPQSINQVLSMEFMHDQLEDGRTFRLFNIIENFNREAFGKEFDLSLLSEW